MRAADLGGVQSREILQVGEGNLPDVFELGQVVRKELTPRQRAMLNARQHRKGITPEERQKCREVVLQAKPWEKSTGPKTLEGKAVSSRNATKHGLTVPLRNLASHRVSIQRWLAALDLDLAHETIQQAYKATSRRRGAGDTAGTPQTPRE